MIESINGSIKTETTWDYQLNEEETLDLFLQEYISLF